MFVEVTFHLYISFFRILAHHADGNPSLIAYLASGNNGVEEMKGFLEDNKVMYGLGMDIVGYNLIYYFVYGG